MLQLPTVMVKQFFFVVVVNFVLYFRFWGTCAAHERQLHRYTHGSVLCFPFPLHPHLVFIPRLSLLIFAFLIEMGFHHVGQASFELLISGDLPTSASQSARITGMRRHTWPKVMFFKPSCLNKSQKSKCPFYESILLNYIY